MIFDAQASITPTAGTPQAAAAALTLVRRATFQADPRNSGGYVLIKGASGHELAVLAPGAQFPLATSGDNQLFDLSAISIDATAASQACLISYGA